MPSTASAAVSSVKEFLDRALGPSDYPDAKIVLFRGQLHDHPVLPKLFRHPNTPHKVMKSEHAMLQSLKAVAPHLRPSQPKNDWDWLSLGQHYGMSTRMSDWSANPLIALFFSVELDAAEDGFPLVYHYPINSTIIETDKTESPLKITHTRVIQPAVHSHRSEAQAAWHVVHAIHSDGKGGDYKFIPLNNMRPHNVRAVKIVIDRSRVCSIRSELLRMGITHSTVYGDYQSVCRSIAPAFGLAQ